MVTVEEIRNWLDQLKDDDEVAVGSYGKSLVRVYENGDEASEYIKIDQVVIPDENDQDSEDDPSD